LGFGEKFGGFCGFSDKSTEFVILYFLRDLLEFFFLTFSGQQHIIDIEIDDNEEDCGWPQLWCATAKISQRGLRL